MAPPSISLADVGGEMRILYPVGLVDPWDVDGSLGVADEQVLHAGAYIHKDARGSSCIISHACSGVSPVGSVPLISLFSDSGVIVFVVYQ